MTPLKIVFVALLVIIVAGVVILLVRRAKSLPPNLRGVCRNASELRASVEKTRRAAARTEGYFGDTQPTAAALFKAYRDLGYPAIAEALETKATPCLRLVGDPTVSPAVRSRIGGIPDLADASLWPRKSTSSLAFLAQVNLEEIPNELRLELLPDHGMLYFFYDAAQTAWGFDPNDKGSWAVLYASEPPTNPSPVLYPADLPEESRFHSVPIRFQSSVSIPDPVSKILQLALTEDQKTEAISLYGEFAESSKTIHQVLGYPVPIQGDMELEVQLVSHGLYCGDPSGYEDPRAKELEAGASEWRLLLQLDCDDDAGMMWGDGGRLYFWVREEDLKARRFDDAWMILQCY